MAVRYPMAVFRLTAFVLVCAFVSSAGGVVPHGSLAGLVIAQSDPDLFHDRFEARNVETVMIYPGELTELDNGLVIGAHPHVIETPVSVEIGLVSTGTRADLRSSIDHLQIADDLVEIRVMDFEDDELYLEGPAGSGFIVGVPVPEEFDPGHLAARALSYADFAHACGADEQTPLDDIWARPVGVYDPEYDLFLLDLPVLGGPQHPTHLVMTESTRLTTELTESVLDWLEETYLPEAADVENPLDLPTWTAGPDSLRGRSEGDGFDMRCYLWHPDSPECNDPEVQEMLNSMKAELELALDSFEQMHGEPEAKLARLRSSNRYYLFDRGSNPDDIFVSGQCHSSGGGGYRKDMRIAYTCVEAAGSPGTSGYPDTDETDRISRHELFHAVQADYYRFRFRHWTLEGTAALVEHINFGMSRDKRGIDLSFKHDSLRSTKAQDYGTEAFWLDLMKRSGLDSYYGLGLLFDEGMRTRDIDDAVEKHTPFETLGAAHWRWARNAVFEGDTQLPISPDPGETETEYYYKHHCEPNPKALDKEIIPEMEMVETDESTTLEFKAVLDVLAAQMYEISLPSLDDHHFYEVSWETDNPVVPPGTARPDPMTRIYHSDLVGYWGDECRPPSERIMDIAHHPMAESISDDGDGETGRLYNSGVGALYDDQRSMYLLVSNPSDLLPGAEYRIRVTGPYYDEEEIVDDIFPPLGSYKPQAQDLEILMGLETAIDISPMLNDDEGYASNDLSIVSPAEIFVTDEGNHGKIVGDQISYALDDESFEGADSFEYTVANRHGFSASANVKVTRLVSPSAMDFSVSAKPSEEIIIDIENYISNPETITGSPEVIDISPIGQADGEFSMHGTPGDQFIRYLSEPEGVLFGHSDSFEYTIENEAGFTDTGVFRVDVIRPVALEVLEIRDSMARDLRFCNVHFGDPVEGFGHALMRTEQRIEEGHRLSAFQDEGGLIAIHPLDGPGDGKEVVMKSLDPSGKGVGWSHNDGMRKRAILWSTDGGLQELVPPDMVNFNSRAMDFSPDSPALAAGQLIPGKNVDWSVPAVWMHNKSWISLEEYFDSAAMATALNERGQVAGINGMGDHIPGSMADHLSAFGPVAPNCEPGPRLDSAVLGHKVTGFLYTPDDPEKPEEGVVESLGTLGGAATVPRAVNNTGMVVGSTTVSGEQVSGSNPVRGFVWYKGEMTEIPAFHESYSHAYDINEGGQVVGVSGTSEDGVSAGLAWERSLTVNLNAIMPEHYRIRITKAVEINDRGRILAWAHHWGEPETDFVLILDVVDAE